MRLPQACTGRTLAVCGIGKLARHLFHQSFPRPPRAVASDDVSGTNASMGLVGAIADTDDHRTPVDSSRRGFLAQAAPVAAGGAAVGVALSARIRQTLGQLKRPQLWPQVV